MTVISFNKEKKIEVTVEIFTPKPLPMETFNSSINV